MTSQKTRVKNAIMIIALVVAVLWITSPLIQSWLINRHTEMALNDCGSQDNILQVDAKGYQCKKS